MSPIPEPPVNTIVAWWDANDDLFAVFHRTDAHKEDDDDPEVWYNADQFDTHDDGPMTWAELLTEMEGFRGPSELVSRGPLEGREP